MVKILIYGFVYFLGLASCFFILRFTEEKDYISITDIFSEEKKYFVDDKDINTDLVLSEKFKFSSGGGDKALARCQVLLASANKKISSIMLSDSIENQSQCVGQGRSSLPKLDDEAREAINTVISQSYARQSAEATYSSFFLEDIDEEWAESTQRTIASFLSNSNDLSRIGINNIECRETRCRLILPAYDSVESDELSELVLAENYQSIGLSQTVSIFPDHNAGELNIYLLRE